MDVSTFAVCDFGVWNIEMLNASFSVPGEEGEGEPIKAVLGESEIVHGDYESCIHSSYCPWSQAGAAKAPRVYLDVSCSDRLLLLSSILSIFRSARIF